METSVRLHVFLDPDQKAEERKKATTTPQILRKTRRTKTTVVLSHGLRMPVYKEFINLSEEYRAWLVLNW